MKEATCVVQGPTTVEELERAIRHYHLTERSSFELFCHCQAMEEASRTLGCSPPIQVAQDRDEQRN